MSWRSDLSVTARSRTSVRAGTFFGKALYVAVPNRMWAERIDALLKRYRVKTSVALDGDPVRGDPRTLERAGLIVPYARLALATDSDDAVAWRLWCGLGHRWVRAEEWARLEADFCLEPPFSVRKVHCSASVVHDGGVHPGPWLLTLKIKSYCGDCSRI